MAISRSRGARLSTSFSPIRTWPPLIPSSPARIRRAVVLPDPDGPTRTTNCPSATSKENPSSAMVSPNCFLTSSNEIAAIHLPFQGARKHPGNELPLKQHIYHHNWRGEDHRSC